MKKFLFLLLVCLGVAACDDFILTDGRTVARGYVTDSLTGQGAPGVSVFLYTCNSSMIAFGKRCRDLLDSAVTDANGYYQFKFRDQRRTNFAVGIGEHRNGVNFAPVNIYLQPNPDAEIVDERLYLVREGKKNQFNFLVKTLKTIRADLRINTLSYERFFLSTLYEQVIFNAPATPRDTTVYLKAPPLAQIVVQGLPPAYAPGQVLLETTIPPDAADTIRMEFSF